MAIMCSAHVEADVGMRRKNKDNIIKCLHY